MEIEPSETHLVAAIDFGTTYSGYAYSTKDDYEKDKLKISPMEWKSPIMISLKTPTTVLLGPNKEFVAFGYDAESRYTKLAENDDHKDYFYFRRFKMVLYNEIRKSEVNIWSNKWKVDVGFIQLLTTLHREYKQVHHT